MEEFQRKSQLAAAFGLPEPSLPIEAAAFPTNSLNHLRAVQNKKHCPSNEVPASHSALTDRCFQSSCCVLSNYEMNRVQDVAAILAEHEKNILMFRFVHLRLIDLTLIFASDQLAPILRRCGDTFYMDTTYPSFEIDDYYLTVIFVRPKTKNGTPRAQFSSWFAAGCLKASQVSVYMLS